MSDKSPLFFSAFELYAHAVELYASKNHRNFKFIILHLANSVELLCKDALLDLNESIYKNPKETLTIWAAFDALARHNVVIPGKQHIELLIDDRNTIQHRFGFPDDRSTYYYLDEVGKFLRLFLSERYSLNFDEVVVDYLAPDLLPLVGVKAGTEAKVKALMSLAPPMAVIQAYEDWKDRFHSLVDWDNVEETPEGEGVVSYNDFFRDLSTKGYINAGYDKWKVLKSARDQAAHGQDANWQQALDHYFELVTAFNKAEQSGYRYKWERGDWYAPDAN